jgi:hypothetical protein
MNYTPIYFVVVQGGKLEGVISFEEILSILPLPEVVYKESGVWYFTKSGGHRSNYICPIDEFYKLQIKRQLDIEVLRD